MSERDDRDEFDRIVEGLDLDLTGLEDLDAAAERRAREAEEPSPDPGDELPPELREDGDEETAFYRQVPPARLRPARGTGLAWAGVLAAPLLVAASLFFGFWVPEWFIGLLTVVAVSSVAWLFWRLPERGPSQPDWPDDGAEL